MIIKGCYAMEPCLRLRRFRLERDTNRSISSPALNPLSYRGSSSGNITVTNSMALRYYLCSDAPSLARAYVKLMHHLYDIYSVIRPVEFRKGRCASIWSGVTAPDRHEELQYFDFRSITSVLTIRFL